MPKFNLKTLHEFEMIDTNIFGKQIYPLLPFDKQWWAQKIDLKNVRIQYQDGIYFIPIIEGLYRSIAYNLESNKLCSYTNIM